MVLYCCLVFSFLLFLLSVYLVSKFNLRFPVVFSHFPWLHWFQSLFLVWIFPRSVLGYVLSFMLSLVVFWILRNSLNLLHLKRFCQFIPLVQLRTLNLQHLFFALFFLFSCQRLFHWVSIYLFGTTIILHYF